VPVIIALHYSDPREIDVIDHSHISTSAEFVAAGDFRGLDREHIRMDSIDINKLEGFFG
jgi:hypothetical protein